MRISSALLTVGAWLLHFSQLNFAWDGVLSPRDDIACTAATRPRELTDRSGWFTSPNFPGPYTNSANCQWLIKSPDKSVILDFLVVDLESGYDRVVVYNGDSTSALVLADLTGIIANPPRGIQSSVPNVLVVFTTDTSVTRSGFNVTYTSAEQIPQDPCDSLWRPMVNSDFSGTFQSNGFPVAYPNSANCQWVFVAQGPDDTVEIAFDWFATEGRYDYARVYDGTNASAPLLGEVHGNPPQPPTTFQSTQKNLFLQFLSDSTVANPGFNGTYRTVEHVYDACGSILNVSPDEATISPSFDLMCHLDRSDEDYVNTQCYDLIQKLPGIGDADALLSQGGNFGCYSTADDGYASAQNACFDNFQWSTILSSCASCPRLFVCIRYGS